MNQPPLLERLKDKNCKVSYNYKEQSRDGHEDVKYDIENKTREWYEKLELLESLNLSEY